ncbi:MAG: 1-deoxy-D-xylulose-5-phosphate synthase N-terminal domain-containing protein, partial [Bacteroidota bacterium]|nr:1-deoxy-D-xylulose-5-phosphate synthase N-terminal domain-containing protein [Bacteroidota bacterium]
MEETKSNLLTSINNPEDLRKLNVRDLPQLCKELRQFIIDEVSCNPGHLGANLGVVELTVALHYIYKTPYDLLVWDVGHQSYGHKILTGRREVFKSNRKYKGISGFPRRSESPYDTFGVGHSSTSISAALGMAVASNLQGEPDRKIVAIIGDGSMTGGMAFEGLNNASVNRSDLLVILNDNNMAIDPNVGGMSQYLLDITRSETYNKFKKDVWDGLGRAWRIGHKTRRVMQRAETMVKSLFLKQSNLFEALGFRYFGPVDGHDVVYLTKVLDDMRRIPGPKLLHVITHKGKGFTPAEKNQTLWHAPGLFDKKTGKRIEEKETIHYPRYQDVFGETMVELATENPKIVGVTPAMTTGCSLTAMMEKF